MKAIACTVFGRFGIAFMVLPGMHVPAVAITGEASPPLDMVVVRTEVCHPCGRPMQDIEAGLVITTTLSDGGYVAVWQDRNDGHAYGRCYVPEGSPHGAQFRIDAHVEDGILPVIIAHRDGSFAARLSRDGKKFEQRFNAHGGTLGAETQPE